MKKPSTTKPDKYLCGTGPRVEECPTGEECAAKGCRKINPRADDSYKELMGDYGDSPVLRKAVETVDGRDKQEHYGPPEEFMGRLASMWGGYLGMPLKPTDAALMMALLKAARLRTNPDHEDSLVDFAGYARIYERVK